YVTLSRLPKPTLFPYTTLFRSIAYPTGDSTPWNTTTQAFQQINSTEYGIAEGHWRQTVSTGNARKIMYFDALWRPLLAREYDTRSEEHTSELQSRENLVCRLLL